ncbi:hypothetical protein BUE93_11275 [Chromobacterium amazonense]|uniref:Uncharacterized protein n=1 Tax=Chromobacterium amazonense TaxID=1382803 RepID=A0A2S9X586_9NEIS|nr:hypothetical protein BUE93_11275 [Chromobacterium amazonense]
MVALLTVIRVNGVALKQAVKVVFLLTISLAVTSARAVKGILMLAQLLQAVVAALVAMFMPSSTRMLWRALRPLTAMWVPVA